jgi:hypothetical protein
VGRAPRFARPIAEDKRERKRKPKRKIQIVSRDDPEALAIARALGREIKGCELGELECGPCYMRREGHGHSPADTVRHELLTMLMHFTGRTRKLAQRLIADPMKEIFEVLVFTHLDNMSVGIVRPKPRTTQPGCWVRNTVQPLETDLEGVSFIREGQEG